MKRWYAVQTHLHAEVRALGHLERQGFAAYLPRYLKRRRHARRLERVPAPLFPRYLFVNMDLDSERWRAVHSTIGVSRLVCHGDTPATLPNNVVEEIQRREDESGLVQLFDSARIKPGDRVRIVEGAFSDHDGIFECMDDRQRAVLLLDLLGRAVRVRLPQGIIAAA